MKLKTTVSQTPGCDHYICILYDYSDTDLKQLSQLDSQRDYISGSTIQRFNFCPKCGKKLNHEKINWPPKVKLADF